MDIYEYFNSRDVAEHCRKLGRSFTSREMAYLIWQSSRHTLHQKIAAWMKLIVTMPNEAHKDFEEAGCCGSHDFLRKYIDRMLQFLADFEKNTGEFAYSYERLYAEPSGHFMDESALFASYDLCIAVAVAEAEDKPEITAFRVKKRKICRKSATGGDCPMLYLTPSAEPMGVYVAPYRGEEDLLVYPFGFYGMFVDIPTPFKCGDIVTGTGSWGTRVDPAVIHKLPEGNGEDFIDMCAELWELDSHKRIFCHDDVPALSLEYYRGKLEKHSRFLVALRNHIRGVLPLEDLLRSYSIILRESFTEDRIGYVGWEEGMKALAGLDKETILIP